MNELVSMCSHAIENFTKFFSLGYLLTKECHGKIKYLCNKLSKTSPLYKASSMFDSNSVLYYSIQ